MNITRRWWAIVTVLAVLLSALALTSSASQIRGDIDKNGKLNSVDIRLMLRYIVGNRSMTAEERTIADCDGNNRIDTQDARYVLNVITLDLTPSTLPTDTTTVVTTTTTRVPIDDDGYYDDIVKP